MTFLKDTPLKPKVGLHKFVDRATCPVCYGCNIDLLYFAGSQEAPIRFYLVKYCGPQCADELVDHYFTLMKCCDCHLIYQRYIGDAVFLERLYDGWLNTPDGAKEADRTAKAMLVRPRSTRDVHELMWVSRQLRKPLSKLVTLDYGMGFGLWAKISRNLGCQSFGFDLSETRRSAAQAVGIKVLREDEFPVNAFDFINTEQVFEHVPALRALAQRLSACLKSGGILKICVPWGENIEQRIKWGEWQADRLSRRSLDPVAPLEHINCFKYKTLRRLAADLGLRYQKPQLLPQFAYITHPDTWSLSTPLNLLKELTRPFHRLISRRSLYVWLMRGFE